MLKLFIDRYVDTTDPGEPRFDALTRVFVTGAPAVGDQEELAELRLHPDDGETFAIYLHGKIHDRAIITITEEGDLVLGLDIDYTENDPGDLYRASDLMVTLVKEFGAAGGLTGVELAPPRSRAQWREDAHVLLRTGSV